MEGLVNYGSEDEHDDYAHSKLAVRERSGGNAASTGRTATDSGGSLKRSYESSKSGSYDDETAYHKGRNYPNERFQSGNTSYHEDKYKIDRKSDNSRDHREKKNSRESRSSRDVRDDGRDYDYNQNYDQRKLDDHKRYREQKRDYKRDANDSYRDDKKYNHYDERKMAYSTNNKNRFSSSKVRYDDKKHYDDRFNEVRRGTNDERRGTYTDDRKKEFNDRRNYNNDERKTDRRNDDRRPQRSYDEDRLNAYRPRRSHSPLPSYHSKSNNKYTERREESNIRRERKRYSRSRSRSRSQSADNSIDSNLRLAKDLKQKIVPSEEHRDEIKYPEPEAQTSDKKTLPTARNFEALLTLPLSENAPKHPNVVTVPVISTAAGSTVTTATVQLPSYYNPNVINTNRYAEQVQKRKLIWGAKKVEDSASKWGHAQFSQDQDGKVASKFMRLMGIKHASGETNTLTSQIDNERKSPPPANSKDVKSREAMFSTMEQQYEVARQVTHTMRGVGLGFSSQSRPY